MANSGLSQTPRPVNEPVFGYLPGSAERKELKATLQEMSAKPLEIPLVIGGEERKRGKTVAVISPQDKNKIIAHCQQATEEDVSDGIHANLAAWQKWNSMPWEERCAVFLKAADLLTTKYRQRINAATMLGQSKTCHQAELDSACELIDFLRFNVHFANTIYQEQPMYSSAGQWNRLEARGLEGFVYAIAPFNFTAISVNLVTSPALMGCVALWKPAPTAVLSSYIGMQALVEAGLPAGVINFIPGDPQLVSRVALKHPDLAGIHFTGSTATFEHLWQEVAKNISTYKAYPRVVGETGGKGFVFAHPSANVDALVTGLVRGAFEFQGQKCSAASRAYIPESLWPRVREDLIRIIKELKVGDPAQFSNFMGAVIDQRSFTKIKGYITHAQDSSDAEVICGGQCDDSRGFFISPTVIRAKNPAYRSLVEEIFGPVLTVYVYRDSEIDAALQLCDRATPYSLTGAVFATDRHFIAGATEKLRFTAGNFYINDKPTGAVVGQQPFGGSRKSGTNDKAGSVYNLLRWVSHRTLKENFLSPMHYSYPFMQEG